MQDEVGDERFLERRGKTFHELVRQAPDEADRVRQQILPTVDFEAACRRVERLEEPVADGDVGAGERVQERRLAGIRVAGQCDHRRLGAAPGLPAGIALALEAAEPPSQNRDPAARQPAVGLQLRLSGAACAEPASEPLEVLPEPSHPREVVLQLRQLDLELALRGHSMLGEDVEDQLRPVDHPRLEGVLELSLLHRRELVVDEQRLGAGAREGFFQLDQLPLADVGAGLRPRCSLDQLSDGLDPCGARELLQLAELAIGVDPLRQHGDDEPALGLGTRRRIRLA